MESTVDSHLHLTEFMVRGDAMPLEVVRGSYVALLVTFCSEGIMIAVDGIHY